jgi:hypothetical protein
MDYVNSAILVQYIYHLQPPPAGAAALGQVFAIATIKGTARSDDHFRFGGRHAVFGNMVDIPIIPPKVHGGRPFVYFNLYENRASRNLLQATRVVAKVRLACHDQGI